MDDQASPRASDQGKKVKKFASTKTKDIINHFSTSGAAVCVATATTHPLVIECRCCQSEVTVGAYGSASLFEWDDPKAYRHGAK